MEILRSFASSFRSVNRMGDTQSTPAEPEGSEPDRSTEKPWNPNDISSSSDEETAALQKSTAQRAEPDPPPDPPQDLAKSKEQRQRANKFENTCRRRSHKSSSGSISDYSEARTGVVASSPVARRTSATKSLLARPDSSRASPYMEPETDTDLTAKDTNELPPVKNGPTPNEVVMGAQEDSATGAKPSIPSNNTVKLQFPCPQANAYGCGKTFPSKAAADRHGKTHSSQKLFACSFCTKKYSRPDLLKKHHLSHSKAEIGQSSQQSQLEKALVVESSDSEQSGRDRRSSSQRKSQRQQPSSPFQTGHNHSQRTRTEADANNDDDTDYSRTHAQASVALINGARDLVETVVRETPQPKSRLKRKRGAVNDNMLAALPEERSQKRRRRQSLSPPISLPSNEPNEMIGRAKTSMTEKPNGANRKSQIVGHLDAFAKPWTPGSDLRHPLHNPKSSQSVSARSVQVIVPRTSNGGSSSKRVESWRQSTQPSPGDFEEPTPLLRKQRTMPYTSPKGKRKADNDTEYSSPPVRQNMAEDMDEDEDEDGEYEPQGIATSFAKRTPARRSSVENGITQGLSLLSQTQSNANSQVTSRLQEKEANDDDDGSDTSRDGSYACQECGRKFKSRGTLRKHEKQPHFRAIVHECDECSERFKSLEELRMHQKSAGHGDGTGQQGRKGAFSDWEVRKLQKWKDSFCDQYDIRTSTFNQMMTDSSRRSKGFQWPYRFISKAGFLQEYYDTLPDRNRRSMHRYRERAFQNVPENQEWTKEDDAELVRLVHEIGPKWVEIGQMMTRTQDSVNQRWRHKLKYKGKVHQGEWLTTEEQQLKTIVAEVKRESNISLDPDIDVRMPWDTVSRKMKGRRTAQQCSNKWRLMHQKREGNKFVKSTEIDRRIGTPSTLATPSKMSQRLGGQTPSITKPRAAPQKKFPSDEYVHESDEEEASLPEIKDRNTTDVINQERDNIIDTGLQEKGEAVSASKSDDQNNISSEDEGGSPAKLHNPLPSRTPRQGISLSQTFAQTQANTSALRAPTTTRRPHTQTEMPTPGIPMQLRPSSSPLREISVSGKAMSHARARSQDEDAIMAEPESTDEEVQPVDDGAGSIAQGSSDTSPSRSSDSDGVSEAGNEEPVASPSRTGSSSSSSEGSTSSDGDESDEDNAEDSMVLDTQKDSFVRSLQLPDIDGRSSLQSSRAANRTVSNPRKSINWNKVFQGIDDNESATSSDTEDEGDIMHH